MGFFDENNGELKTEMVYAILKNGRKISFNYCSYKKLLENHQKISEDKEKTGRI